MKTIIRKLGENNIANMVLRLDYKAYIEKVNEKPTADNIYKTVFIINAGNIVQYTNFGLEYLKNVILTTDCMNILCKLHVNNLILIAPDTADKIKAILMQK